MANTRRRGFAGMEPDKQREIASEGGRHSSGRFGEGINNPSAAGKRGAQAQSREDKAKGGRNSHRGDMMA